ncbi:MAG: hypothetical protein KHW79_09070 [Clostridiales bacterium]|nr:hypothetical protein [Clostridiales bacterium]
MHTEGIDMQPAFYTKGVTFKTKFLGYEKKDVDEYLANLHNTMQSSSASYEEKTDQLKNNLKMVTKEMETVKSNYAALEQENQNLAAKLELVEDQSANIERLMLENENMKKQIEENENYVSIAAEMKAKNVFLESRLQQYQLAEEQLTLKQKELENTMYQKEQAAKENTYQYKSEIAELNTKMQLVGERHQNELTKLREMLLDIDEKIKVFSESSL